MNSLSSELSWSSQPSWHRNCTGSRQTPALLSFQLQVTPTSWPPSVCKTCSMTTPASSRMSSRNSTAAYGRYVGWQATPTTVPS